MIQAITEVVETHKECVSGSAVAVLLCLRLVHPAHTGKGRCSDQSSCISLLAYLQALWGDIFGP